MIVYDCLSDPDGYQYRGEAHITVKSSFSTHIVMGDRIDDDERSHAMILTLEEAMTKSKHVNISVKGRVTAVHIVIRLKN